MGIGSVAFFFSKAFGDHDEHDMRTRVYYTMCYVTTLTPNEGSGAVKNFRNHNFILNQDKTIYQMWELPSPLGLHSTGSACGLLYHPAASPFSSHRSNNLSGQRDTYGDPSSSCGTLWQLMVQWSENNKMSNLPTLSQFTLNFPSRKPDIPLWPLPVRKQCTEHLSSALVQAVTAPVHI